MRQALTRFIRSSLLLGALVLTACQPDFRQTPAAIDTPTRIPTPLTAVTPRPPNNGSPAAAGQAAAMLPSAQDDLPAMGDLVHYSIQVEIDYPERSFNGLARVSYTNTEGISLDRLYFRLLPNGGGSYGNGSLVVPAAFVDGVPAETALSLDDSVLEIRLPAGLAPGESAAIDLQFDGLVPQGQGDSGYGIYSHNDGVMALAGWYPILAVYDQEGWHLDPVSAIGDSVYSDMAFYTVEMSVSRDVVSAATGVEVNRNSTGELEHYRFVSGPARDFFMIMSPDFQVASESVDGTRVNSYYFPGQEAGGRRALELAAASLEVYNDLFGPYPYRELDLAAAPLTGAAGVEFPGIILAASQAYDTPSSAFFSELIAHEVAHQWWYNLVGNHVFENPWMDEGLTTYSSALFVEATQGEGAYQSVAENYRAAYERLVSAGRDEPVAMDLAYFENSHRRGSYGAVVYAKGALFFHTLRENIGDEAFFEALQSYYESYRYQIAYPQDMLSVFEDHAGQDLEPLYQEWLYSSRTPFEPENDLTLTPTETATVEPPTPTPTPEAAVRFAVIGDYGLAGQAAEDVANLVKSWNPDFIITTGDNNYPNGEATTIDENIGQYYHEFIYPYKGSYGAGAEVNRFFPSLGNHDFLTLGAQPYLDYFELPGNQRYYDFTWGPLHMFAINSDYNEPDGVGRSSVQAAWLRDSLSASTLPWKIVYMHNPPYSSGYHGSIEWMRWPYKEWGATAVLAAHDHIYERLIVDDFPYFINGLGGGPRYYFNDEILPGSQVRYAGDNGAQLVTATAGSLTFEFYGRSGELIDSYSLFNPGANGSMPDVPVPAIHGTANPSYN